MRHLAKTCAILLVLTATLFAKNHKAEKLWQQGRDAEFRKEYERALDLYEQAEQSDPRDPTYELASRRVRFQAAAARVEQGLKLRAAGQLDEAAASFRKAYAIDPSYAIAAQELKKTLEMIDRAKKGLTKGETPEEKGMTPAQVAEKESQERSDSILPLPELKPISRKISTLKMNNQPPKVLFETVGKLAGVNVIFDPEFSTGAGSNQRYTIDLSNTTLDEALDYLAIQTKSFWKPLSPNTIFVTQDNVQKRRDFEDYVVKVFYIKNATTFQELQEINSAVRSVTEIRRAFTYNSMYAILVRGTADQVALAEKLIQDLDKPKGEVVVDVIIMEANRSHLRDLAATFTTGGATGINIPVIYNPQNGSSSNANGGRGTGGSTNNNNGANNTNNGSVNPVNTGVNNGTAATPTTNLVSISSLKNIHLFGDFSVAVPGALLQAVVSDSDTRVLQQPQVRAVDMAKATLKIGDRIPYASGSFGSGIGASVGVGISPVVQTSFNFADVGVNVDMTPRIHSRDEISLHIDVELSNLSGHVDIGGISQPIISSRHVVHDIRLKEGEVNLLGGLVNIQDTRSADGVPGLVNIPGLGGLFGHHNLNKTHGELMIALVPHIVRAPEFTPTDLRGVAAGNDANIKLNFAPREAPEPPATTPTTPGSTAPVSPGQPPAATAPAPNGAASTVPAGVPNAATPPAAGAPGTPGTAATTPAANAATPAASAEEEAEGAAPKVYFNPADVQAVKGAPIFLYLQVDEAKDLFAAPLHIKYDPSMLKVTSVRDGGLLKQGGGSPTFTQTVDADKGEITVTANRPPGTKGVSGSGTLALILFQTLNTGRTIVSVEDIHLKNSQMKNIKTDAPSVNVSVM